MNVAAHHGHDEVEDGKFFGKSIPRVEDERFLTGKGTFIDDLQMEGMVHAITVRSQHAHARLKGIDATEALKLPGVIGIITAEDIAKYPGLIPLRLGPLPGFHQYLQRPLASDKVLFVGEPVAMLFAESRAICEDALELVEVDCEPLEPVTSRAEAMQDSSILHEATGTNLATRYTVKWGDPIEEVTAGAAYRRKETFRSHRQAAVPMETRGLLATWDAEGSPYKLRVWGPTKVTFHNRRILATLLEMPAEDIEFIEVDVGGSFGSRGEFYPEDFLVPFAAMHLKRPVKWTEDRRENLMSSNHSREIECEVEVSTDAQGHLLGIEATLCADMGAYVRTNGGVVPSKCAQWLPGPYRYPAINITIEAVVTNKTPVGTYRGPGLYEACFFRERLFDLIAKDLGLTPVEFRKRNMIRAEEMPFKAPELVPHEASNSYDCGNFFEPLEAALEEIGYDDLLRQSKASSEKIRTGVGIACFVESSGAGPFETARLALSDKAEVSVSVGVATSGQGHETIFAQIAADELEMHMDDIQVFHGTTSIVDNGCGTYHSRGAVMAGSAVKLACEKFRQTAITIAAKRLNLGVEEIDFTGGAIRRRDGNGPALMSLQELAQAAPELSPGTSRPHLGIALEETAKFEQTVKTFPYGTHVAHVAVDTETGKVDVLRYLVVEDIGNSINPLLAHGQVIGGAVQGIGGTFLDEMVYGSDGQLLTGSFADYLLATATDFPVVEAISLGRHPSPLNPLGVKGAGEGGILATGGALTNAVAMALEPLGVKITSVPLNPNNIRKMLSEAGH